MATGEVGSYREQCTHVVQIVNDVRNHTGADLISMFSVANRRVLYPPLYLKLQNPTAQGTKAAWLSGQATSGVPGSQTVRMPAGLSSI